MNPESLQIGSRLELFVDTFLIDRFDGVQLRMHAPQQAPPSPSPVKGYYMTVLKDGEIYRAYYRDHIAGYQGPYHNGAPGEITCYAESRDGHHWTFPRPGIFQTSGPQGQNVILAGAAPCSHNFSPFLDTRPGVPASQRFKALAGIQTGTGGGIFAYDSADGLHWQRLVDRPVITARQRAFDSQNVAFWSQTEECYVCYYRTWQTPHGELRTISRKTSKDLIHWSAGTPMNPNVPGEHLYTSGTHPYFRAPHIYIALPTRFLPERGDSTDILLMTSRGGTRYDRTFMEALIRPGLDPEGWGNRSNYVAQNVVPTGPAEMSVYHAPSGRRYHWRTDGFASLGAGYAGGEMLSKVLSFLGEELVLNYSTSAAGSIRIEIQSPEGRPLPGYRLSECQPLTGDRIAGLIHWQHSPDVSSLAGKPVRLRFTLQDADVYSLRFRQ